MDQILKVFGDRIQTNVSLKNYTTVGIGGEARYFFIAKTEEELEQILSLASHKEVAVFIMGSGSNLLISDKGIDGLVVKNEVSGIEKIGPEISVRGGTILQELVDFAIKNGLEGIQRMTGIPGTVAGAVYGNAGAYGQTISDCLTEVTAYDGKQVVKLNKKECLFSYRNSGFKTNGLTILKVSFCFSEEDPEKLASEAKETLAKRQAKYTPGIRCPGSFFKNVLESSLNPKVLEMLPERKDTFGKVPAWLFLEEVGAKGQSLGDIKIADFHANLFMNLNQGTAEDFWTLASTYAKKVKEKFGITLEPEVQLVSLPPLV